MNLSTTVRSLWPWGVGGSPVALASPRQDGSASPTPSDTASEATRTQLSSYAFDLEFDERFKAGSMPSDAELLRRAHSAHVNEDCAALESEQQCQACWRRLETVGRFVLFQRREAAVREAGACDASRSRARAEVLCAGRLNASLEEVASVLGPTSHDAHNAAMAGLYSKNFIFGSVDRTVDCDTNVDASVSSSSGAVERLTVKTSSFLRAALLARNEQWCYLDFFRRKPERDGFTISQRALPPDEFTPSRVTGAHARVTQLHGLNVSCLVDRLPTRKELRVVYKAWFEPQSDRGALVDSSDGLSPTQSSQTGDAASHASPPAVESAADEKAHSRRLMVLARGVSTLPGLINRRRFGVQVPADLAAFQTTNTRCPCCTRGLNVMKLTLVAAASALATRSWEPLSTSKKRCYLCGYVVCGDCWTPQEMESVAGRVANIVVCSRCQACVDACEYSELHADREGERERSRRQGRSRVVADAPGLSPEACTPLLVDFLATELQQQSPGSAERTAVLTVLKTLLKPEETKTRGSTADEKMVVSGHAVEDENAVAELRELLLDEQSMPALEDCVLANSEKRDHAVSLPEPGHAPPGPIPEHEAMRLASLEAAGLLLLARKYAPERPSDAVGIPEPSGGMHELEVLCQLAARTLGADCACVAVLSARHNHVLVSNVAAFANAAVPRDQSMCQHTAMGHGRPFLISHPEADVRFHAHDAVAQLPVRFYAGFPILVPRVRDALERERPSSESADVVAVGTLCCLHTHASAELTRWQYATMKRLARAASTVLRRKGRQLQQQLLQVVEPHEGGTRAA